MGTMSTRMISLLALAALAIGCAKEKKYEAVFKDSVYSKSEISTDPNDPYVYVPSVGETPMSVTASRAFWMGEQKLATFKFEEGALVAMELPSDSRFAANTSNQSPILRVKIDHKDYRCQEDQYGECGNKEEEIDDHRWQDRRFFKADFADLKVTETNTLPEQTAAAFTKCFGEEEIVVKNVAIEKDAVNLHVQKRWKANILCADFENITSFTDLLRDSTFTVNYYYSFVKLSKLAAQDYKPFVYPFEDSNTFGYFKTDFVKLSNDGRNILGSKQTFMNRWNPNRKEIVYHLNDGFYEEGMEGMRASTEQAVQTINNSFEKANIDMKITLKDGRGLNVGDLRYNFLILVSDPQASGVIGYGPTVANPRTGEILKGQTVMYHGSMKRVIEQTYDDLVAEKLRAKADAASVAANLSVKLPAPGAAYSAEMEQTHGLNRNLYASLQNVGRIDAPAVRRASGTNLSAVRASVTKDHSREMFSASRRVELSTWLAKLNDPNIDERTRYKATMEEMSHHCFYHDSMVNWEATVAQGLKTEETGIDGLKPWIELTEDERAKVIETMMPIVWVPTLVHELGHNLGLRHNFSGSEDETNFYSQAERATLGIKRHVPYSSIMDYSYSELNVLPIMGKYDLAALKFGYKRELELTDGSSTVLADDVTFEKMKAAPATSELGKLKASIKDFQYCTDEHVEVNPGCKRHDEGTSSKEIVQFFINAYKKDIAKRNYRNNRARFSIVNDSAYYYRIDYTFEALRRFFEQYDRIASTPSYASMMNMTEAEWEAVLAEVPENVKPIVLSNKKFFQGLGEAAGMTADFFIDILKTPDLSCALVLKGTDQLAGLAPLKLFSPDGEAVNCFDKENVSVNEAFEVVGEVGRFFNHQRQKSLLPGELAASADELSVRGMWMDKLLATHWLTVRELDNTVFDEYRSNYLDYPVFGDKIRAAFMEILTDKVSTVTELRLANGAKQPLQVTLPMAETHQIKTVVLMPFHARRGLNRVQTDFRSLMLPMVKKSLLKADDTAKTLGLYNALSVIPVTATTTLDASQIATTAEFRDANGMLISRYAATKDNAVAVRMMAGRNVRQVLDGFDPKKLEEIYGQMEANTIPAEIPEELKPIYGMQKEVLAAYLGGELPEDDFLIKLFEIMAKDERQQVSINVQVNAN